MPGTPIPRPDEISLDASDAVDASAIGIFLHVGTVGRYDFVLDEVVTAIETSGALDACAFVEISVVGTGRLDFENADPKYRVVRRSDEVLDFEHPTLTAIHAYCTAHPKDRVLYLNCLGGRHVGAEWAIRSEWRRLLHYLFLAHRERCLEALRTHDVCVVQWSRQPMPHATSNNWWANAAYIASLVEPGRAFDLIRDVDLSRYGSRWNEPTIKRRHSGEFWLGLDPSIRPFTLFDLTKSGFPRSEYRSVPWWNLAGVDWVKIAQRSFGERPLQRFDVELGWRATLLQVQHLYRRVKGKLLRGVFRIKPRPTEHRL